jgi:hypothetical protein
MPSGPIVFDKYTLYEMSRKRVIRPAKVKISALTTIPFLFIKVAPQRAFELLVIYIQTTFALVITISPLLN